MMADHMQGYQKLGSLLGGGAGAVREEAYQEGRYRTAQTENALAQARETQLQAAAEAKKAEARARTEDDAIAAGMPPEQARMLGTLVVGEGGSDFSAGMTGFETQQEMGFRDTLADPAASLGAQFAAGQGVQGKMLNRREMMGAGDFMNIVEPEDPLVSTPLGKSMVLENEASARASDELASLRGRTPRLGGSTGTDEFGNPLPFRVPANYKPNPNFDPSQPASNDNMEIVPIEGGPSDPDTKKPLGVRERQVIGRVMNAGLNTANDLENIMRLPSEADTGFLGTGLAATPATTVMEATIGQLKYKISPSEVRDFQRILGGLTNQMATMELMGMAGSEGIRAQYDALALRPYDTIEDKMLALALMRQTTENGLQTLIDVNPLPTDTLKAVQTTLGRLSQAIPFTVEDVMNLKYSKDPNATIASAAAASQVTAGVPSKAAVAPAVAGAPAESGAVPEDDSLVDTILAEGLGTQAADGQIMDARGWHLERDPSSDEYAWVNPERTEAESVAR